MDEKKQTEVKEESQDVAIVLPRSKQILYVLAIMIAVVSQCVQTHGLPTAMVAVTSELGGAQYYALMFSICVFFVAILSPAAEKIGDAITRRRLLIIGLVCYLVQYAVTLVATSVPMIIVGRCIGHIGVAFVLTVGLGMFVDIFPHNETAKYNGIYGSTMSLCGCACPILAGLLVDYSSWRWLAVISLITGVIALILMIYACPRVPKKKSESKVDVKGLILLGIALLAVSVLFNFVVTLFPWLSLQTAILIILGAVFFIWFGKVEKARGLNAIMPPVLFKNKFFLAALMIGLCGEAGCFLARIYIPSYAEVAMQQSATIAGFMTGIPSFVSIFVGVIAGNFMAKTGKVKATAILVVIFQIATFGFICIGTPETNIPFFVAGLTVLYGVANGIMAFMPIALVHTRVPRKYGIIGTAVAMLGISFGSVIFLGLAGQIQNSISDPLTAYRTICVFGAILTAINLPFLIPLKSDKEMTKIIDAGRLDETMDDSGNGEPDQVA